MDLFTLNIFSLSQLSHVSKEIKGFQKVTKEVKAK